MSAFKIFHLCGIQIFIICCFWHTEYNRLNVPFTLEYVLIYWNKTVTSLGLVLVHVLVAPFLMKHLFVISFPLVMHLLVPHTHTIHSCGISLPGFAFDCNPAFCS